MRPQLSLRSSILVICLVALAAALIRERDYESAPLYLHVYGTVVDYDHDDFCIDHPVVSRDRRPWVRVATVHIYDRRPFGFQTPNDRMPAIAISGKLSVGLNGRYTGQLSWMLDDSNLTYDFTESVDLTLDTIVYIDESYNMYVLSRDDDPYEALLQSVRDDDPFAELSDSG